MVNVIIPVYKAKDTLPDALNSLVAQTKKLFWVTIVQDCDGEDYSDIIKEYQRRGLHISLLSTKTNSGPGVARQVGLDASNNFDFVMFCDADDMFMPNAIDAMHREIQVTGGDLIMGNMVSEQPGTSGINFPAQTTPVQWCGGKIYRTKYLKDKNIRFRDDLRLNEDSYFNLVACNSTDKRYKVDMGIYFWRYNKESLTRKDKDDFMEKSWVQYVASQIYGIQKLYELNGTIKDSLLAQTILNIYDHVMSAIHEKLDITPVEEYYQVLRDIPEFWEQMGQEGVWKYINQHVKCSNMANKHEMYFYKYMFFDWFQMVGGTK